MKNVKKPRKLDTQNIDWVKVIMELPEPVFSKEDLKEALTKAGVRIGKGAVGINPATEQILSDLSWYFERESERNIKFVFEKSLILEDLNTHPVIIESSSSEESNEESISEPSDNTTESEEKEEVVDEEVNLSELEKALDLISDSIPVHQFATYALVYISLTPGKYKLSEIEEKFSKLGINKRQYLHAAMLNYKKLGLSLVKIGMRSGEESKKYLEFPDKDINLKKEVLNALEQSLVDYRAKKTWKRSEILENLDKYLEKIKGNQVEETPVSEPEQTTQVEQLPVVTVENVFGDNPIIGLNRNRIYEPNDTVEVRWLKWLIIESSLSFNGSMTKLQHLLNWIKTNRNEEITEQTALSLIQELRSDFSCIKMEADQYVSIKSSNYRELKVYDPTKLQETIYVTLNLKQDEASQAFPGLIFKAEETLTEGRYLYEVTINGSLSSEIGLKKLVRYLRIKGKIYTSNSMFLTRAIKLVEKEDKEQKEKEHLLRVAESMILAK